MIDIYQKLNSELALSKKDADNLKKIFKNNFYTNSKLAFGSLSKSKPQWIIGAPCIRNDLSFISLNTLYQIIMPITLAKKLGRPCLIFLGVQEEIILKPELQQKYKKLGETLEQIVKVLASLHDVEMRIINTSALQYNELIEKTIGNQKIFLTNKESTNLFSISKTNTKRKSHSNLRSICSARVVACHTYYLLSRLVGDYSFLIVEDMEQFPCFSYARKFNKGKMNFYAFLPAPNFDGSSTLFKSLPEDQVAIDSNYKLHYKSDKIIIDWVEDLYLEIIGLISDRNLDEPKSQGLFKELLAQKTKIL